MKTILVDAVDCFVIEEEGIYKPMHDLLEQYPSRKIILTGADDNQMDEFGLRNMPYELFTLKHNPEKTDPEYYKKMLEHYDLRPEEVIYFEHNLKAVESAQSVGIKTYYYDFDKKDLKALKRFLEKDISQ
ncbi:MAG: hypothetical protein JWN37_943 [Candidatus Nomurabacteria bacterium]|nr:hypothetical protein [Candidatus Nomurabacteria bacterium]